MYIYIHILSRFYPDSIYSFYSQINYIYIYIYTCIYIYIFIHTYIYIYIYINDGSGSLQAGGEERAQEPRETPVARIDGRELGFGKPWIFEDFSGFS